MFSSLLIYHYWPGVDAATYRDIVRKAHDKGLKVIVLLNKTYGGKEDDQKAVNEFIGSCIERLNDLTTNVFAGVSVDAFEIGNEPNMVIGKIKDPAGKEIEIFRIGGNTFAWLLRRVWEWKIANNRPEFIISGGILSTYYDVQPWWNYFFDSGALRQGPRPFDAFGIHPYNPDKFNTNFADWKSYTTNALSEIEKLINEHTGIENTPLYVTEFGWQVPIGNTCEPNKNCVSSPTQMADGMQAAVEAFNESRVVPVALWYDYRDDDGLHGLRQQWDGQRYPVRPEVWQRFKLLAGGTGSNDPESYWSTTPTPPVLNLLYQLHNNGELWKHTGPPCSGSSCPGWQRLDTNSATVAIAAAGDFLYQLHRDGSIWKYTGTPCTKEGICSGWQMLDNNRATVAIAAAAGNNLYQLHNNGEIWRYTGTPCSGGHCSGWEMLDNNRATVAISSKSYWPVRTVSST